MENQKPIVDITSPNNNETIQDSKVALKLFASDQIEGISSIVIKINGKMLAGSTERGLVVTAKDNSRFNKVFDVSLKKGENEIEVVAYNLKSRS